MFGPKNSIGYHMLSLVASSMFMFIPHDRMGHGFWGRFLLRRHATSSRANLHHDKVGFIDADVSNLGMSHHQLWKITMFKNDQPSK
jgi:hypothetical protein